MKRIILLLIIASTILFAGKYEDALERGKSEGKNVVFMVTKVGCPWCIRAKENVIPSPEVKKLLESFILVELDKDTDEYPDTIFTTFVPSFFTIDSKNGELINERIGFQSREKFVEFLKEDIRD